MQMHTSEGGLRLDTRRPFIPQGCDQQGRQEPTIKPTGEPLRIQTRPSLLARIVRWWRLGDLRAQRDGLELQISDLDEEIAAGHEFMRTHHWWERSATEDARHRTAIRLRADLNQKRDALQAQINAL